MKTALFAESRVNQKNGLYNQCQIQFMKRKDLTQVRGMMSENQTFIKCIFVRDGENLIFTPKKYPGPKALNCIIKKYLLKEGK